MTDKQIIIDVTQCPYYKEGKVCTYLPFESKCEGDCNWTSYKEMEEQLKAKEQECEELKIYIESNEQQVKEVETLVMDNDRLINELDQLKAENEELTTINARLLGRLEVDETDTSLVFNLDKELRQKEKEFYTAIQKVVKLKQTLTEIKEIAEETSQAKFRNNACIGCAFLNDKILQKISECEGNNEN